MTPCVMASPLSLATYLAPAAADFDLVVIDEASQMRPEDALGSLLRAHQAVIVGDRNALPAKDVSRRITPPEELGVEADEDDGGTGESLLDWALRAFPAPRRLATHYRSRCTSLVAFANRGFYGGTLAVPPNVRRDAFSIDVVRAHGSFKAGRNAAEIVRIVAAAIDFMIRNAELPADRMQTLGIVAIGREQRDAICDEFSRMARLPAVETYLAACNLATGGRDAEPFFIKDIENVAGDARDVIMVSLTLAREFAQPRAMQRFGAISAPHGAHRVNVLSTRARRRIVLFASMAADDIVVGPESGDGAQALVDYLRYVEGRRAETGPVADAAATRRCVPARNHRPARGSRFFDRPHVGSLRRRSRRAASARREPLCRRHRVDGPGFARVGSARERDRLRDAVLSAKGWSVLRAWSADWFANPQVADGKARRGPDPPRSNPDRDRQVSPAAEAGRCVSPGCADNASGGGETAAAEPLAPQGASP